MMKDIWAHEKNQKICAFDIDGVIADYPKCWIDFCTHKNKIYYSDLNDLKNSLSYTAYKKLKMEYRTSGYKRTLPLKPMAAETIKALQDHGYKVILLTARPYRKHREIWKDTTEWLKNNGINVDGIIWESEKHWAVINEFPYLRFMVEDNAELANQVARIGYKVYLLDNEYNRQELLPNVKRINNLNEIIKMEALLC